MGYSIALGAVAISRPRLLFFRCYNNFMTTFSVLSWNIQGNLNGTGYTFFRKIKPHLLNSGADIIALQEMNGAEKRLTNISELNSFHKFVPASSQNVIFSKFPLVQVKEIEFPKSIHNGYLENFSRTDIVIHNQILRLYNCHFE